jgi:hypothetical protein
MVGLVPGVTKASVKTLTTNEQKLFKAAETSGNPIDLFEAVDPHGEVIAEVKVERVGSDFDSTHLNELLSRAYEAQGPLKNVSAIRITSADSSKTARGHFNRASALFKKNILEAYGLNHMSLEVSEIRRLRRGSLTKDSVLVSSTIQNKKDYDIGQFSSSNRPESLQRLIYLHLHDTSPVRDKLENRRPSFNPVEDDIRPLFEDRQLAEDLRTLGVAKGASAKEITDSYRKLVRKLHADIKSDDRELTERLQTINTAYDRLVRIPKKRSGTTQAQEPEKKALLRIGQ